MVFSAAVIIGAPRSGTNMLRDVLARLPGVATWPCDEINYIWRHGNVRYPSDELMAEMAYPWVRRYIRRQFAWVAGRYKTHAVVEKTCANSLRVPFVDAVLPEARYIFIHRHGLDTVGSAMKRWKAPLDIPYIYSKARFVPVTDLPYYAARYCRNHAHRLFSEEKRLASWGPQLDGMQALLRKHPLDEICALQWQRCVEAARDTFEEMPSNRWLEVLYEEFVRNPGDELERIVDFLGMELPAETRRDAVEGIHSDSIGKGRAALDADAVRRIEELLQSTLVRFGYA